MVVIMKEPRICDCERSTMDDTDMTNVELGIVIAALGMTLTMVILALIGLGTVVGWVMR